MFEFKLITSKHAKAYNDLVQLGLKSFPIAFETDFSQVENRPLKNVIEDLNEIEQSTGFLLGAFSPDNELVGTVFINPRIGPKVSHRADVFFMFILKKYQNKGVGKLLLNNAIERSKKIDGLEQLELSVSEYCPNAIHLYKKAGFQVTGSLKRQTKIDNIFHDYLIMWKLLKNM